MALHSSRGQLPVSPLFGAALPAANESLPYVSVDSEHAVIRLTGKDKKNYHALISLYSELCASTDTQGASAIADQVRSTFKALPSSLHFTVLYQLVALTDTFPFGSRSPYQPLLLLGGLCEEAIKAGVGNVQALSDVQFSLDRHVRLFQALNKAAHHSRACVINTRGRELAQDDVDSIAELLAIVGEEGVQNSDVVPFCPISDEIEPPTSQQMARGILQLYARFDRSSTFDAVVVAGNSNIGATLGGLFSFRPIYRGAVRVLTFDFSQCFPDLVSELIVRAEQLNGNQRGIDTVTREILSHPHNRELAAKVLFDRLLMSESQDRTKIFQMAECVASEVTRITVGKFRETEDPVVLKKCMYLLDFLVKRVWLDGKGDRSGETAFSDCIVALGKDLSALKVSKERILQCHPEILQSWNRLEEYFSGTV